MLRRAMMKRTLSSANPAPASKRLRSSAAFNPNKIATVEAAAAIDADPPLHKLLEAVKDGVQTPRTGKSIVYWMRMGDLRISDNRALSLASAHAKERDIPLIVLFLLSPQDYVAHDRGPRRIDFTLRNLASIKGSLAALHIPLHTSTQPNRRAVPHEFVSFLERVNALTFYANIEYEVDELRRDLQVCDAAKSQGISAKFVHDKCVVEPGVVVTGANNKTYAVYTPYQKLWLTKLNADIPHYLEDCPAPHANSESVRDSPELSGLFDSLVPESVPGFELDAADRAKMEEVWPAGETKAQDILKRFISTKSRSCQLAAVDPLAAGAQDSEKRSRIAVYDSERDRADRDTTSRISPYLAAGVLSARACVRATMSGTALATGGKVDGGRTTGIGRWVQEIAWRDFYNCILAGYPRVSMGRPFLEKYANVRWEGPPVEDTAYADSSPPTSPVDLALAEANIEKWKSGHTGFPIVDAAMRCLNEMGWVHNRMRMICAMFLVKDLMIDWRVGEKYFMEKLIDGDLASNNGGWQWSASTGVDPCPYFRIFNPYLQSAKADPTGDFIRHYVPELAAVRGPDLHKPSASIANKLGYPLPIVKHDEARDRAIRRFKEPGTA
ncbi:FAD binding domain of DNA photolyase-domain-containing protein [Mycena belliarum]|uniref:FAD binding domain of DNA photolyase-domain-containing protein n=1 Tax=Mycena belliarum TaxID=1033014 RepID=A0AAD6UEN9_9AGAR|nr:FAD binding domain of DNA photolyase-domain-containing protein [Mycena belliae]